MKAKIKLFHHIIKFNGIKLQVHFRFDFIRMLKVSNKILSVQKISTTRFQLKSKMWDEIKSVKQENKRELNLNGDKFTKQLEKSGDKLDVAVFELSQLNFLQLSNSTRLCEIPDTIQRLENLQSLLLFGNSLKSLPGQLLSFITCHNVIIFSM